MSGNAVKREPVEGDILDTSSTPALRRWDELLGLQVDAFFSHELEFLYTFAPWQRAASVLDAGCGNGCYLARLHRSFPDKRYVGIDLSPSLIERAKARWQGDGIEFAVDDFFALHEPQAFDLIVMRFIVQHLEDFGAILDQAARTLRPGGGLFIIEPDLIHSVNVPETPVFETLFRAFEKQSAENGRLRARLDDLPDLIAEAPGWVFQETSLSVQCSESSVKSLWVSNALKAKSSVEPLVKA